MDVNEWFPVYLLRQGCAMSPGFIRQTAKAAQGMGNGKGWYGGDIAIGWSVTRQTAW